MSSSLCRVCGLCTVLTIDCCRLHLPPWSQCPHPHPHPLHLRWSRLVVLLKFRKQNYHVSNFQPHWNMKLCKIFQVLASSVAIADHAGEIVRSVQKIGWYLIQDLRLGRTNLSSVHPRSVFSGGQLGIVEKTGADDLQTQADRSAQVGEFHSAWISDIIEAY